MANIHFTALGHCSPQNPQERFVLIRLQAEASDQGATPTEAPPRDITLVIDRSGSMSGHPLKVAATASAQFVGALRLIDTISVFAYDNSLTTIAVREHPSERLQRKV
jgi:Ca-activated chloride channel family protein